MMKRISATAIICTKQSSRVLLPTLSQLCDIAINSFVSGYCLDLTVFVSADFNPLRSCQSLIWKCYGEHRPKQLPSGCVRHRLARWVVSMAVAHCCRRVVNIPDSICVCVHITNSSIPFSRSLSFHPFLLLYTQPSSEKQTAPLRPCLQVVL
jgi:hypothetical protein